MAHSCEKQGKPVPKWYGVRVPKAVRAHRAALEADKALFTAKIDEGDKPPLEKPACPFHASLARCRKYKCPFTKEE
jgi:hypothetical protein